MNIVYGARRGSGLLYCFLSSVVLHKLSTTASSDQNYFGSIRHRNKLHILSE